MRRTLVSADTPEGHRWWGSPPSWMDNVDGTKTVTIHLARTPPKPEGEPSGPAVETISVDVIVADEDAAADLVAALIGGARR